MAIGIVAAFIGGLISFLAPCVLPLIPGFLAYLSGVGAGELQPNRRAIFINSVFFVAGFVLVFAALGVLINTLLSRVAYDAQIWLARVGGTIIVFFGLYLAGVLKLPWLGREFKIQVRRRAGPNYWSSFLFGLAFAAGWTPCVGPVLGAILGLAAAAPGSAFSLLLSYALGLGLPFLVVGWFTAEASGWINKHLKLAQYLNIVFGIILIILGILVFTQYLNRIADFGLLQKLFKQ